MITRDNALNETDRIVFENENVIGSILTGAIIDDLTFKNYTTEVDGDEQLPC